MIIKQARFLMSNTDPAKCPEGDKPEYAFIGRSNVGKSSLVNMLTGHKKLAKISGQPGKTREINHFLINEEWYLADLPGYGYAKVSKTQRSQFDAMTKRYLNERENLVCLFILLDSRHEPQGLDKEFISYCGESGLPIALIFTKADKQSPNKTQSVRAAWKRTMLKSWEEMPPAFITSAEKGEGREELLAFIAECNEAWKEQA